MLPMLRPWGFAPRDAKAIEQAQLSEEYTATQQPLYSTLPDADDVVAIKGYSNTRMAVRPNQRIIMLNKGIGDKGFTICCDCGAAMPGDDPSVLKYDFCERLLFEVCKTVCIKNYHRWAVKNSNRDAKASRLLFFVVEFVLEIMRRYCQNAKVQLLRLYFNRQNCPAAWPHQ